MPTSWFGTQNRVIGSEHNNPNNLCLSAYVIELRYGFLRRSVLLGMEISERQKPYDIVVVSTGFRFSVYTYVLGSLHRHRHWDRHGVLWLSGSPHIGVGNSPDDNCRTVSYLHLAAFSYGAHTYVLGSVSSFATDLFGFQESVLLVM